MEDLPVKNIGFSERGIIGRDDYDGKYFGWISQRGISFSFPRALSRNGFSFSCLDEMDVLYFVGKQAHTIC